jgi:hypothetical protein
MDEINIEYDFDVDFRFIFALHFLKDVDTDLVVFNGFKDVVIIFQFLKITYDVLYGFVNL